MNIWRKIFQSETIKNSTIVLSGRALGQAVSLLAYPILTRIFSKEDFGIYAVFCSILPLLAFLGTGKYEDALLITKDQKETISLLGFTLKLLFFVSFLLLLVLFFFRDVVFSFFHMETITEYWYYIPFSVFIFAFLTLLVNLSNREKQFKTIAVSGISNSFGGSVFKIIFGFLSFHSVGLILGNVAAQLMGCSAFYKSKQIIVKALKGDFSEQREIAKKHNSFPKYNMPISFINSASHNLPFLLLTSIFGHSLLGLFSLSHTIVSYPVGMVTSSLYGVFFEKISSLKREHQSIRPFFFKFWKNSILFCIPVFIFIFILAPQVFKIIFGQEWTESGVILRYLLPWMFVIVLYTPTSFIVILFGKQDKNLWIEIVYFISRCIALYIGIYYNNFKLSIFLYVVIGTIYTSVRLLWNVLIINQYEQTLKD